MRATPRHLASGKGRSSSPARSKPAARSPPASSRVEVPASSLAESLSAAADHEDDVAAHFSLAHELAAAMMPEPSMNSSLADELGLDFGADEDNSTEPSDEPVPDHSSPTEHRASPIHENASIDDTTTVDRDSHNRSPTSSGNGSEDEEPTPSRPYNPLAKTLFSPKEEPHISEEPLEQLSRELAATDAFITRLKRLDTDTSENPTLMSRSTMSTFHEPPVERYTSRMIRQLNDTVRERENQIRELVSIENEFRRIEGELGGVDAIGSLDALDDGEGLFGDSDGVPSSGHLQPLGGINEDDEDSDDPDEENMDDDDDVFGEPSSPARFRGRRDGSDRLPSPTRTAGNVVTPSSTIPHLAHMREVTTSLMHTLSTMSEHAQENGAATADAGRKIRALKNRMTGWQADWESAERSRVKIAEWESEAAESTRIDGRIIVQQQLDAFAQALADAALKTKAILAS